MGQGHAGIRELAEAGVLVSALSIPVGYDFRNRVHAEARPTDPRRSVAYLTPSGPRSLCCLAQLHETAPVKIRRAILFTLRQRTGGVRPYSEDMAVARLTGVLHVECPAYHWTKAVLAYKQSRTRCFFCPHCQHVWDTTDTARKVRSRLNRRPMEVSQEPEMSEDIHRVLDRRVGQVVAHVRRTLVLLNRQARVRLPAIVQANPAQPRLRERSFKEMLPRDILKQNPTDEG
jgi:hypothetical protein